MTEVPVTDRLIQLAMGVMISTAVYIAMMILMYIVAALRVAGGMADAPDSSPGAERREGPTPSPPT